MSLIIDGNSGLTLPNGSEVVGGLTLGTAKTATGTYVDFTDIPSWVKRITVMFNGVSTNGTSTVQVQIGTTSGIETTSYVSTWSQGASNGSSTTGFAIFGYVSTDMRYGHMIISNFSGTTYVVSGVTSPQPTTSVGNLIGAKTLSGALDRIRITTVNGTDVFDAGTINIMYE